MRNLATIRQIDSISNINNYDKICVYTLKNLGWSIIAGKNEFKKEELIVYIEPDTILPVRPEFEFLRKRCWNSIYEGFRIRIMKLGGIYSQGIIFPLLILPKSKLNFKFKFPFLYIWPTIYEEGLDVTSLLEIIRYDEEEMWELKYKKSHPQKQYWGLRKILFKFHLIRKCKRPRRKKKLNFPSFFPKTNETRLQTIPEILEHIKEKEIYISEKIDGTSGSFCYKDGEFGVYTRNTKIDRNANPDLIGDCHWFCVIKYDILNKLSFYCKKNNRNLVLQGEIIGPRIQSNKYERIEPELYLYQIYDINKQKFLDFPEFIDICTELKITVVPIIFKGNERNLNLNSVNKWIKFSIGKSYIFPLQEREGIVVRTCIEETIPRIKTIKQRLSFKVVSPEFQMQN